MPGTKEGGRKAAAKNLANDPDFYKRIGTKGGKNGHTGGFAANPELARTAGKKGGKISRRYKVSPPLLKTTSAAESVEKLSKARPVYQNLSGDNESGDNISTASPATTKRTGIWGKVRGRFSAANR
jgi:hypothetical protein